MDFEKYGFNVEEQTNNVLGQIKDWFKDKNGPAVLGISGGKDSTICAALLAKALGPENVIGVQMPNGVQKDISDSDKVFEVTGIKKVTVNIGDAYEALTKNIRVSAKDGEEFPNSLYSTNTPARIRMVTLYGVAALNHGFVINTCNLSESIVGWETYGGDGFGDFSPIGRLTKTEVVELGDHMGLPKELVHKVPDDGMCGASDEDKMGFTYKELDEVIRENIEGPHFEKICSMNKKSHFKHENIRIPTCNVDLKINKVFNWD